MKIGFTGTRKGMSPEQKTALHELLSYLRPSEFHHGCCLGADSEAHKIAETLDIAIVLHPPTDTRAADLDLKGSATRDHAPFLKRNKCIVEETDILVAAPRTHTEILRSGTWATVRHARKLGKSTVILWRKR